MNHEVTLVTSTGHFDVKIDDDLMSRMGVTKMNYESTKLFVSSWLTLLSDSPLDPTNKPKRLYQRFINQMCADGLQKTVVGFTGIAHNFVSQHTLMGSDPERGLWLGDTFKSTPVFFEYSRYYQTGDLSLLAYLYSFLNFGKKLDYKDDTFKEIAFRDWERIEDGLADIEYDANDTDNLRTILRTLLPTFSYSSFWPKFGPGSVAERGIKGRNDKISTLSFSAPLDLLLFTDFKVRDQDYGLDPNRFIPIPGNWSNGVTGFERIARLEFVDKNLKVARSICMEPNTNMYSQQGVLQCMLDLIGQSYLSRFIDISDQTVNQELAYAGSYSGEIDTIDLSAASDSVGVNLVKRIFPDTWLAPMLVTRSTHAVVPGGSIRKLNKFAPMGSALCFPTQCIIFAAVCIYAAYQYGTDRDSSVSPALRKMTESDVLQTVNQFSFTRSGFFQRLAVYGDDICCDRKITDNVMSILRRLGFSVNTEKSFCGSQSFRESCGKYYLNGCDITPLYFRVKGVKAHKLSAPHVASVVHTINAAAECGFVNLRRFLIESLRRWNRGTMPPIPFLTSESEHFGIRVYGVPYNTHLKTRSDCHLDKPLSKIPYYQRREANVWSLSYNRRSDPDSFFGVDSYEYMRWWASRYERDTSADSQAVSRSDYDGVSIRRRWIPLS